MDMSINGTVNGYISAEQEGAAGILRCRGVRGATTAGSNDKEEILAATRELLFVMIKANHIQEDDVASVYFTVTHDLNATYPAYAARQLGWSKACLLCGLEIPVPNGLEKCVRVMLHWNTAKPHDEIVHVYLRQARQLRPDRDTLPPLPLHEIEAAIQGNIRNIEELLS